MLTFGLILTSPSKLNRRLNLIEAISHEHKALASHISKSKCWRPIQWNSSQLHVIWIKLFPSSEAAQLAIPAAWPGYFCNSEWTIEQPTQWKMKTKACTSTDQKKARCCTRWYRVKRSISSTEARRQRRLRVQESQNRACQTKTLVNCVTPPWSKMGYSSKGTSRRGRQSMLAGRWAHGVARWIHLRPGSQAWVCSKKSKEVLRSSKTKWGSA